MRRSWIRRFDWDAAAGIAAAGTALILHLLHIVNQEVVLAIVLVILALLLIRDLRRENDDERLHESVRLMSESLARLQASFSPPDTILVGPRALRSSSTAFAQAASGEMVWFNVCLLMFKPQELFDALLRPALENSAVTEVRFILDPREEDNWERELLPKARACHGFEKLLAPKWCPIEESVSFILADVGAGGKTEAHLSFWGEPFMSRTTGRDIPRYVFHVQSHSELIPRLIEMERSYRRAL